VGREGVHVPPGLGQVGQVEVGVEPSGLRQGGAPFRGRRKRIRWPANDGTGRDGPRTGGHMDIIAWAARTSRTRRGNCLVGCLIALAVGVILLIVAGVVIALNWRGWASAGMDKMVDAML